MSYVQTWRRSAAACGPVTSKRPMWETSNIPAAVRTALCSSMMPVYWTGISQPAKGTMRAPRRTCSAWRQVPRGGRVHGDDQRPSLQRPLDDALLGLQRDQRQHVEGGDPGDALQHDRVLGELPDVYGEFAAGVRLHDAVVGGVAWRGDQAQSLD